MKNNIQVGVDLTGFWREMQKADAKVDAFLRIVQLPPPDAEKNQLEILNAFGFKDMNDFLVWSKSNPDDGWETLKQMENAWESMSQS